MAAKAPTIPLLMYHSVGALVASKADTFLNVSQADFSRQMRALQRMGFVGVTFADAVDGLAHDRPLPRKPVCVTFDDGYQSVLDHAAPVLDELNWPGTVFVPTAYVGSENSWDMENGKPLHSIMDWDGLKLLEGKGWEIAGHTRSHPHLEKLEAAAALEDIERGRDELAAEMSRPPLTFCYPYGGQNEETPRLVRQAGFIGACTTKSGLATMTQDPFLLPRVKVAYRDGLLGLLYRLKIRPLLP